MARAKRGAEPETLPSSHDLAWRIGRLAKEKKAVDVLVLDLRRLSAACDYFVLASGMSEPQVRAITDHIDDTLSAEGIRPWHVEGRSNRKWVLLDYVEVVVHVFHQETREYYRLENLWADAGREEVPEESGKRDGEEEA